MLPSLWITFVSEHNLKGLSHPGYTPFGLCRQQHIQSDWQQVDRLIRVELVLLPETIANYQ